MQSNHPKILLQETQSLVTITLRPGAGGGGEANLLNWYAQYPKPMIQKKKNKKQKRYFKTKTNQHSQI